METLVERITRHEGVRLKPYRDTAGKLTMGVGRNLDDVGISMDEAMYMLDNDIRDAVKGVNKALPWMLGLDDARRDILYEMAFQLGLTGLLGFKKMLLAVREREYKQAAQQMRDSKWYKQTPARAEELAGIMETEE